MARVSPSVQHRLGVQQDPKSLVQTLTFLLGTRLLLDRMARNPVLPELRVLSTWWRPVPSPPVEFLSSREMGLSFLFTNLTVLNTACNSACEKKNTRVLV